MSLAKLAQDMEYGSWALKPIRLSDDKTELEVMFFVPRPHNRKWSTPIDIMEPVPTAAGNSRLSGSAVERNLGTVDDTDPPTQYLRSGDTIKLKTPDPAKLPLPDMRLLDMQYRLCCLTRLSGSAEPQAEDYWEDSDVEDGAPIIPMSPPQE
jgi:hypothetical protein